MSDALDFSQRAHLEEEMDGPCSYEELRRCLIHLAIVNRFTLAHHHTMRWLEGVVQPKRANPTLRLLDIGCGYGDMLRRIEQWANRRDVRIELIGADINPNAIRAALEATPTGSRIKWVVGDACTSTETQDVDLVTSCGVFHHLDDPEIVRLLAWMDSTATVGWYITDLHRIAESYRVFDLLMRGPWWQRFIRPDGLRSIRRSFLRKDWERLCAEAGVDLSAVRIEVCRPGRLCVGRLKPPREQHPSRQETAQSARQR
jgi:SAM-dependent methyltransferase